MYAKQIRVCRQLDRRTSLKYDTIKIQRGTVGEPELRDVGTIQGDRSFRFVTTKELVKVAVLHVLDDDAVRLVGRADAQQPHDVGVFQAGHDLHFTVEFRPAQCIVM